MKKSLFASLAAVVLAAACTTTNPTVEPKLTVEGLKLDANKTVNVAAAASDLTFTVNANITYTIVSDKDWAIPAPAVVEAENNADKTTSIKIGITANGNDEARTAKISIVAEENASLGYEFTISQAAAVQTKSLSVYNTDLTEISGAIEVESIDASAAVMVVSTVSWTATPSEGWITVEPASLIVENYEETPATVSFKIEDNESTESRTATVTFSAKGVDDVTLTVIQDCVFTAVVQAMSVSDFNTELLEKYPEETSIAVYIGNATAEVASGSFGLWPAHLWTGIIADWDNNIEQIKTILGNEKLAMTAEELDAINATNGYVGAIFSNLDSDTEYTLVAMLTDTKGRVYISHSSQKTKAYDYNGFIKLGQYKMIGTNTPTEGEPWTSEATMTLRYAGEENKYTLEDICGLEDGSNWHAEYDPTAKTLTLNGLEKGYEDDGNLFGGIYGYWNRAQYLVYCYESYATATDEEGNSPVVFDVDENGYLSALKNYMLGAFVYQMDSSFQTMVKEMGWGALFQGAATVITPVTSTAALSSRFETAGQKVDLNSHKSSKFKSDLKKSNKLYK